MNAPNEPTQRTPFQGEEFQPKPFYQTPEFMRGVVLLGVLALFGAIVYFVFAQRTAGVAEEARVAENRAAAQAILPSHPLTPEEIEARKTALLTKLEGSISDIENGQPLTRQTPGFTKLLSVLQRYTPEEIDQRSKLDFDWDLVMKDPDAWRGEFLRVRGILHQVSAIKLEYPIQGRTDFYRGILSDGEKLFYFVDLLERPTGVTEGEPVDLEGVMYRTVTSESREGVKHEDPLLVARSVRRVPSAVETGFPAFLREHTFPIFGALAFLVFGVGLLFSVIRQGKKHTRRVAATSGSFQQLFDKKLRDEGKVPPPHV